MDAERRVHCVGLGENDGQLKHFVFAKLLKVTDEIKTNFLFGFTYLFKMTKTC